MTQSIACYLASFNINTTQIFTQLVLEVAEEGCSACSFTMEVLRPSTPMPIGRALTRYDCFQMRRQSSDSLPPLQPLIEEKNSKMICARRNQVREATRIKPRRHIVSSREGETVEIIALSAAKTSADLYKEECSKTVLPGLNSERLLTGRQENDALFIESATELNCPKRNIRVSPVRARNINQYRQSTEPKNDSSQSSNSAGLPTVAGNAKTNLNTNCRSLNRTVLQKHIEQQEKDYDSASVKADIFHRWIKSQQE